jgi:hypothetical protein
MPRLFRARSHITANYNIFLCCALPDLRGAAQATQVGGHAVKMPFGKYCGYYLSDIPSDYIRWLRTLDNMRGRLRAAVEEEWRTRQWNTKEAQNDYAGGELDAADRALLAELIRAGYRALAFKYHPDRGGDVRVMQQLNQLMERLRETLAA